MSFYKLISGIFEKKSIFMAENGPRGLKLGCYVTFMSFYKLISGIFEKKIRFLWPKMGLKVSNLVVMFLLLFYEFLQINLGDFWKKKFRFLWPKMSLSMCQNQFFADISKVKVLELNVVSSTNINIRIPVIFSYV